jgi:hypothetical protein
LYVAEGKVAGLEEGNVAKEIPGTLLAIPEINAVPLLLYSSI